MGAHAPFAFWTITSKFLKQVWTRVTPQRGVIKKVFPRYANYAQRAETWTKHSTLSHPPQVQWQHQLIFLRFLPGSLLWFPQSLEQLSAAGPEEAARMPGPSSSVSTGRTKASRAASTVVDFKDSCNLARHSLKTFWYTVLMMQINDSKLCSFC